MRRREVWVRGRGLWVSGTTTVVRIHGDEVILSSGQQGGVRQHRVHLTVDKEPMSKAALIQ